MTGSEGLLGVVTEVTVLSCKSRQHSAPCWLALLLHKKQDVVSNVISAGIIPAGMEMMDAPAINAAEDFVNVGYPRDAAALLIVELDGPQVEVDFLLERVSDIMKSSGSTSIRLSQSEEERNQFWAGRKSAFPAVGRISPDYLCMDGTIPRKALPEMLTRMSVMSQNMACELRMSSMQEMALYPLILFDANTPGELSQQKNLA